MSRSSASSPPFLTVVGWLIRLGFVDFASVDEADYEHDGFLSHCIRSTQRPDRGQVLGELDGFDHQQDRTHNEVSAQRQHA